MSYGGVVDAATAEGHFDEAADWCGATAAMITVGVSRGQAIARRPSVDMNRPRTSPLRRGTQWRWATRSRAGSYSLPVL
jgi:hypothetical protein